MFKGFHVDSTGKWFYNGLSCVDFNHAFNLWRQGI